MLRQMDVSHFWAFGFTVFRGLLSTSEAAQLREEADHALEGAYGIQYRDDDAQIADAPAFDIPMMSDDLPLATRLVADDPRLWQLSHHLMGGPTVPSNGEVTCFRANTKWHADMTPEVAGVKFLIYLDPCSPETGQLHVLPGSHLRGVGSAFWDHLQQDPQRQGYFDDSGVWPIPSYGINTEPGDAIAFHSNLLHSSVGGDRRLLWDIYYFEYPMLKGPEECTIIRDALLHIGDYGDIPFDHDKWPVWRDWMTSPTGTDARATAVNRLRRLGVLDTPGADVGQPQWQPRLRKPATVLTSGSPARRRPSH